MGLDGDVEAGDFAQATGVLFTWTVTPQSHAAMQVMGEHVVTRAPGIHYSVIVPTALSNARSVLQSPAGPLGDVPLDEVVDEHVIMIEEISVGETGN